MRLRDSWISWAMAALTACTGDGDADRERADAGTDASGASGADSADDGAPGDGGGAADAAGELPESAPLWPQHTPFPIENPYAGRHPGAVARWSRFWTHVGDGPRPRIGNLGALGLGNGHVFGFVGYGAPLNTLHTLAGPTYEKHDGFFGDYAIRVSVSGVAVAVGEEWAVRALDAPVAATVARAGDLTLHTFDFVPWTEGEERSCFVRVVSLEGPVPPETALIVDPFNPVELGEGALVERRDGRTLMTWSTSDATTSSGGLTIPVPPGEAAEVVVLHCAASGAPAERFEVDVDGWLRQTAAAYRAWEEPLADVEVPDAAFVDFVDGMKLTLITQTTAAGASCPMSQYSRTWARDNIGPTLAWIQLGAHEDLRAMLDYIYAAVRHHGDLANSYDADLDVANAPPAPDWAAMPPLSGRVAAETPSVMVWMYGAYARATGDAALAEARWGFLSRAMWAQAFDAQDLLPFSNDETYRAAMNAALGLALEYPHDVESQSSNSSFLWLGAARWFADLARANGRFDEAGAVEARALEVEETTIQTYLRADGCFAAYRDRASGAVSLPFEDASLMPTWVGWRSGADPVALANVACLVESISPAPGVIRSPLARQYVDFPALGGGDGVYTGMLPGYALSALTATAHPDAQAAFVEMARSLDTSGNFAEYLDASIPGGLQLLYDATGLQGDYTAKYRPWEGGINLAAALDYLFGFAPDAPRARVALRPHLPDAWNEMALRRARVGAARLDLALRRGGDAIQIDVTSTDTAELLVDLDLDHGTEIPEVTIAGARVEPAATVARGDVGARTSRFSVGPVTSGRPLSIRVR